MSEAHDRLTRKLESIAALSDAERSAIADLPLKIREVGADVAIVRQGDHPSACCLVLDGLVCSSNVVETGARQITSFFVPGDVPDLQSLLLKTMDHSLETLTPCRLAFVAHTDMIAMIGDHPGLGRVLWRESLITAALYRQWVVNAGRRGAYARIAHIICELTVRLRVVGLAGRDGFTLALTQAELGDAAGLSTVHVNRVLQELKADGLVVFKAQLVEILDWAGLQRAAEFDATYLHLAPQARAIGT